MNNPQWVLPFSLQLSSWLHCSGKTLHIKKNTVQFATHAHTRTELYIRAHTAQAAAELQRAGTLENIDHMILLPLLLLLLFPLPS